jgi:hypothetical protein
VGGREHLGGVGVLLVHHDQGFVVLFRDAAKHGHQGENLAEFLLGVWKKEQREERVKSTFHTIEVAGYKNKSSTLSLGN